MDWATGARFPPPVGGAPLDDGVGVGVDAVVGVVGVVGVVDVVGVVGALVGKGAEDVDATDLMRNEPWDR